MKWSHCLDRRKTSTHGIPCKLQVVPRLFLHSRPARDHAVEFPNAHTRASGLRVPTAIGDFLMLRILRESGGGAIAIDDDEMIQVTRERRGEPKAFSSLPSPACFAALRSLIDSGTIKLDEQVVVFNTGSGIKYPRVLRVISDLRSAITISDN